MRLEAAPDVLRAAPSAPAGRRRPQLSQRPAGRDSPRRAESGAAGRGAPSVRADRTAVRRRLKGQLAPSRRRGPHRSSQARVRALPRLRARPRVQGSAGACAPRRRAGRQASGTRGIFLPPRQAGADTSSAGAAWRAAGRAAPRRPSPGSCRSGSSRAGGRRAAKMPHAPCAVRPRSARAVRAPEADIHRAAAPAAHAVAAAPPSIGYSAPQASGPGWCPPKIWRRPLPARRQYPSRAVRGAARPAARSPRHGRIPALQVFHDPHPSTALRSRADGTSAPVPTLHRSDPSGRHSAPTGRRLHA